MTKPKGGPEQRMGIQITQVLTSGSEQVTKGIATIRRGGNTEKIPLSEAAIGVIASTVEQEAVRVRQESKQVSITPSDPSKGYTKEELKQLWDSERENERRRGFELGHGQRHSWPEGNQI